MPQGNMRQNKIMQDAMANDMTPQEFKDFVCTRAFDIISENQYRKFLVKARDGSDAWALSVQASINKVQTKIKALQQRVARLEIGPHNTLYRVCREVLANAGPPSRIRDGYSICALTGVRVEGCIDLSKISKTNAASGGVGGVVGGDSIATMSNKRYGAAHPDDRNGARCSNNPDDDATKKTSLSFSMQRNQDHHKRFKETLNMILASSCPAPTGEQGEGQLPQKSIFPGSAARYEQAQPPTVKNTGDTLLHPRFTHFFLLLWFVCKLDHVLRNFTRCWLENLAVHEEQASPPVSPGTAAQPPAKRRRGCGAEDRHSEALACETQQHTAQGGVGEEDEGETIKSMCEKFAEQDEVFLAMCNAFNHGFRHICTSLNMGQPAVS